MHDLPRTARPVRPLAWVSAAEGAFVLLLAMWTAEGVYFLSTRPGPSLSDAQYYWHAGRSFLQTGVLGDHWPPLYPLIAAAAQALAGLGTLVAAQTVTVWATISGTAWALLRRRGPLAAAAFLFSMAVYPALYLFSRFSLTDSLFACGLLAWALLAGSPQRPRRLGAGAVLAGLVVLRPEAIPVLIGVTAWLLYRRDARAAAQHAALPAAVLLGWAAYNAAHGRGFVFTQNSFWENLRLGNNSTAWGNFAGPLRPAAGTTAVYRALVLAWVGHHPLRYAWLCVSRVFLFWLLPVDYVEQLAVSAHVVPWMWLSLARIVVPFYPLVLWWSIRTLRPSRQPRRSAATAPALIAVAAQWAFVVPFFVQARFRLPALPLVGLVWAEALARWERQRTAPRVPPVAPPAAGADGPGGRPALPACRHRAGLRRNGPSA